MTDKSAETRTEDSSFADQVEEIAEWMMRQFADGRFLYQHAVVRHVREDYDAGTFLYRNKNGNPALNPEILKAFKRLHGGRAKWNRRSFSWTLEEAPADGGE